MKRLIQKFIREEQGQDLIEYAFLAAFIALVVVGAVIIVGTTLNTQYGRITTQLGGS